MLNIFCAFNFRSLRGLRKFFYNKNLWIYGTCNSCYFTKLKFFCIFHHPFTSPYQQTVFVRPWYSRYAVKHNEAVGNASSKLKQEEEAFHLQLKRGRTWYSSAEKLFILFPVRLSRVMGGFVASVCKQERRLRPAWLRGMTASLECGRHKAGLRMVPS